MKKLITIILCITLSYASIQKSEAIVLAAVAPKTTVNSGGRIGLYITGGVIGAGGVVLAGLGFGGAYMDSYEKPGIGFGVGVFLIGLALDEKTDAEALKKKSFIHYAKINGYSKKQ
ncbi:MAG: hypothetical protein CL678_12295, partial [Bdellovibrionaceae bacterium]|nr:hypothetical protein [Pseudobdellovibrionaceae bacterium]